MEPKRILYPLLLLTCIQLSVVIAAFRSNKQTFVANVAHPQIQRKVHGRHRSHIVTFVGDNQDNIIERSPKKNTQFEENPKFLVPNEEVHSEIQRKVKGRKKPSYLYETFAGDTNPRKKIKRLADPVGVAPTTDLPKTTKLGKQETGNNSKGDNDGGMSLPMPKWNNMVDTKTAFFILIGVTVLVLGCFVFRIIRSRSRRKTKKYGILATRGSEVELTPLDQEEDDEDMTVFDANST